MQHHTQVNLQDVSLEARKAARITFIGFPFKRPDGTEHTLVYTVDAADGDCEAVIQAIRDEGGAYCSVEEDSSDLWFMPWPCAAVRITEVPRG